MSWNRFQEFKEFCSHDEGTREAREKRLQRSLFGKRKRLPIEAVSQSFSEDSENIDGFSSEDEHEGELVIKRKKKRRSDRGQASWNNVKHEKVDEFDEKTLETSPVVKTKYNQDWGGFSPTIPQNPSKERRKPSPKDLGCSEQTVATPMYCSTLQHTVTTPKHYTGTSNNEVETSKYIDTSQHAVATNFSTKIQTAAYRRKDVKPTPRRSCMQSFESFLDMSRTFSLDTSCGLLKYKLSAEHLSGEESNHGSEINWSDSESDNNVNSQDIDIGKLSGSSAKNVSTGDNSHQTETISCFDSADEHSTEDESTPSISEPTPSPQISATQSPQISATPSQQATSQQVGSAKKASDWLKQVQTLSPKVPTTPAHGKEAYPLHPDSAKKKKKYMRSGLADQMQRIILRENSERTFWAHRNTTNKGDENGHSASNSLHLYIHSVHCECSLIIARCSVIETDSIKPEDKQEIKRQWKSCIALFTSENFKHLQLSVQSSVRIYPPWQELELLSFPYPVLLCTFYCEKIPLSITTQQEQLKTDAAFFQFPHNHWEEIMDSWSANTIQKELLSNLATTGNNGCQISCNNEVIENAQLAGGRLTVVSEEIQDVPESIMKSIEISGGFHGSELTFQALIQRVYHRTVQVPVLDKLRSLSSGLTKGNKDRTITQNENRWILLVQDRSDVFCEIQVPEHLVHPNNEWYSCIMTGEGKIHLFTMLTLQQRINCNRNPSLFKFITSICSTPCFTSPALKEGASQIISPEDNNLWGAQTPGFCYSTAVRSSRSHVKCISDSTDENFKTPQTQTLKNILNNGRSAHYVSLYAKLLHIVNKHSPDQEADNIDELRDVSSIEKCLYITDQSLINTITENQSTYSGTILNSELSPAYVTVTVPKTNRCFCSEGLSTQMKKGVVLYLKDLYIVKDSSGNVCSLTADGYSFIQIASTTSFHSQKDCLPEASIQQELESLGVDNLLPVLDSCSIQGDLVRLHGSVCGVDEETAFSWLECDQCGNMELDEDDNSGYECGSCKQSVPDPVLRIHLEVFIQCDSLQPNSSVRVKLLQSTVQHLLPVSLKESEEGYDINCILNKNFSSLNCQIVAKKQSEGSQHAAFLLEEIDL